MYAGVGAVGLGVLFVILGYFTPYISLRLASDKSKGDATRAIEMDRTGRSIEVGGFILIILGFLNLMHVLPVWR
jgi:hypothetical protein